MIYPERLQGTDGIRREVKYKLNKDPLTALLNDNVITEKFIECYAYTVSKWIALIGKGNKSIALGYDPRDKDKALLNSAISGVLKAGCNVCDMGIVPTPAVPIFIIKAGLDAGLMISASHNPKDQNGVKIFLPYGLKPLPDDDKEITSLFYYLFRDLQINLNDIEQTGSYIDCKDKMKQMLEDFLIDPLNSWFDENIDTSNITIILDCANGSYSEIAENILKRLGFDNIIQTASNLEDNVNENSGVVDLEGETFINLEKVKTKFKNNKTINTLLELGQKSINKLKAKRKKIIAFIFDADGDRFYRAEYNPYKNGIIILSGDENAILQAKYILQKKPNWVKVSDDTLITNKSKFVTTIESDYNVYISAKNLGLHCHLTGVGDKWILKKAIETYSLVLNNKITEKEEYISEQSKAIYGTDKPFFTSSLKILGYIEFLYEKLKNIDLEYYLNNLRFVVGSEESGHTITTAYITNSNNNIVPVFVGNGLKSAINSFASTEYLSKYKTIEEYYKMLETPFEKGFKKTLYIYYTDKTKLQDELYRKKLKDFILKNINKEYKIKECKIVEESSALYFNILFNDKEIGSIFLRNSGTEDKTGVYLRSNTEHKTKLLESCNEIQSYVFNTMKDPHHEYAKAEKILLKYISENEKIEYSKIKEILSTSNINCDRLITEMEKSNKISFNKIY